MTQSVTARQNKTKRRFGLRPWGGLESLHQLGGEAGGVTLQYYI